MTLAPTRTMTKAVGCVIGLGTVLLLALLVPAVSSIRPRVTAENYVRIDVGTVKADVERLLPKPRFDIAEYGSIGETGAHVTNDSLSDQETLVMGYRTYRRLQWMSREITIVEIFDADGFVATRYRGEGP